MKRARNAFPERISVTELVQQEVWQSSFPGEMLRRLQNEHGAASGAFRVELRYIRAHKGRPAISGELSGTLQPVCQRCLQPMQVQLRLPFFWGLVRDDQEAQSLPEELDPVQLSGNSLDLCRALEDEVLLSMPVAYLHEAGECMPPSARGRLKKAPLGASS